MGYFQAPPEVDEIVREMIAAHHPKLAEFGVTVLCQMFRSKAGLKLHGWPCAAVVKIVGEKDRIAGLADARITIDAQEWGFMGIEGKRSLIDHELCHLVVDTIRVNYTEPHPEKPDTLVVLSRYEAKLDDADRPKLKMRLHDWELGGFAEIVERHGEVALERRGFRSAAEKYRQLLLGDWEDQADDDRDDDDSRFSATVTVDGETADLSNLAEANRVIGKAFRNRQGRAAASATA